jgi:hypothetical protein
MNLIKESLAMFGIQVVNYPKLTYELKAVSIAVPKGFFQQLDNLFLIFTWK